MMTPNPNPNGLPTRCKAWERLQLTGLQRQEEHWSFKKAHKVRKKAARLPKLFRLV